MQPASVTPTRGQTTAATSRVIGSVSSSRYFEEEPIAAFSLVDPNLDQAGRGNVAMLFTDVVGLAQSRGQGAIVLRQFRQHIQRLDIFRIVIKDSLSPRNVADRFQSRAANFAHSFCDRIRHREQLIGVLVEEQVIIAKMWSAHMPVEIFRFDIEREHVREDRVHRSGDILGRGRGKIGSSCQGRAAPVKKIYSLE
jgi:hypothetical protein